VYEVQRPVLELRDRSCLPGCTAHHPLPRIDKYELNAIQVEDIAYNKDKTEESLRMVLGESEYIELRIKPAITVSRRVDLQFK
jgi:hypothetical protein